MSYIINKTDGSVLTEIVDGTVDQTATDLTLVGKNASSYGESFNENFVHILENFANTSSPNNPIQGQLWFDTSESRLKVYTGTSWVVSGGSIVSPTIPSSIGQGDLWVDSKRKQLYFNIGGGETILAGPAWSALQGTTGFEVTDILDTNQNVRTVALLKVGGVTVGIFSSLSFVPYIDGYSLPGWEGNDYSDTANYVRGDRVKFRTNESLPPTLVYKAITASVPAGTLPTNADYWEQVTIVPGFNSGTLSGLLFDVNASTANALISEYTGELKTADNFVSTTDDSATIGTLSITNSVPLILGAGSQTSIEVSNPLFEIKSRVSNQNFQISTKTGTDLPEAAVYINTQTKSVGIYTDVPATNLDVDNNIVTPVLDVNATVFIRGDLTVDGTTTTINSTNLTIDDLTVTVASGAADAAAADGAGLLVDGANASLTYDHANLSWTSTESINLVAGKSLKINELAIISPITTSTVRLENTVVEALGLSKVGTLNGVVVDDISISGAEISTPGTLYLAPAGTVDVGGVKITSLADPVSGTDAVNIDYLNTKVDNLEVTISVNTSTLPGPDIDDNIRAIVETVFPVSRPRANGTQCNVWCTDLNVCKLYFVVAGAWAYSGGPDLDPFA